MAKKRPPLKHRPKYLQDATVPEGEITPPTHNVWAADKTTDVSGTVGAAWVNREDGVIAIKLNAFVTLRGGPNLILRLYPREPEETGKPLTRNRQDNLGFSGPVNRPDDPDEEPFEPPQAPERSRPEVDIPF